MNADEIDALVANLRQYLKRGMTEYCYDDPFTGKLTTYEIAMSEHESYRIRLQIQELEQWKPK